MAKIDVCGIFGDDITKCDYEQLKSENEKLKGLLGVAICPNAVNGCQGGTLINPYGELGPCQWCGMTAQALKGGE